MDTQETQETQPAQRSETDRLTQLQEKLAAFRDARNWAQFHTPKNLASALTVEAAELLEIFQWLPAGERTSLTAQQLQAASDEMADVLSYLLLLADRLHIDLIAACHHKTARNALRYPVETAYGSAAKVD